MTRKSDWEQKKHAMRQREEEQFVRHALELKQMQHAAKLEGFREAHEQLGKSGFELALRAIQKIEKFFDEEENAQVKTIEDARKLASVIDVFMRSAPQIWAMALGIPELKRLADEMAIDKDDD